ncbi:MULTISPECIES: GNAT family N-acetyltransferase [Terrabacteria group]|uniref:GNAT family N-acetyltransferase n=1 Tax=Bacillati TaxID=1783272 RepID=UPI001C6EC8C4|nr:MULTISPECIES: GNAT family N-acetyltransferase [Terrabacteria group]MBW9212237.1 GNAT family N-acetyltransferase [Trueperella sp. zg.1013]
MKERIIHQDLKLIPYYQNDEVSLAWYQDLDICKQVDNRNKPYDLESLHRMYNYLNTHGECYYIEYKGVLIGDISLRDNSEIAIVISKPYQGKHIGRKCLLEIIKLAKEKGMYKVIANIYSFNRQSQYLFQILGFQKTEDEWYEFIL